MTHEVDARGLATRRSWRWHGGFGASMVVAALSAIAGLNEAFTTERDFTIVVFAVMLGVSGLLLAVCPVLGLLRALAAVTDGERSTSAWAVLVLNLLALSLAVVFAPFALRLAMAWIT